LSGTGQMGHANSTTLRLPAPAKLNLCLHVTGRRADGYHELETLFQLLDFGDEVQLTLMQGPGVRRIGNIPGVEEEADLSVRAARLLAAHCQCRRGVNIRLSKRLPLGGGLGGGSSDAASVLVGLNELWELGLHKDELAQLGLQLGADVPVFIHGHSAFAQGVGEKLRRVSLPQQWFVVLWPPIQVETSAIFSSASLTRDTPHLKIAGFPWNLHTKNGLDGFWARTHNDCEPVVRALQPQVAATLDVLARYGPARMSGTGACAFARFAEEDEAHRVLEDVRLGLVKGLGKGLGKGLARGLDREPAKGLHNGPAAERRFEAGKGDGAQWPPGLNGFVARGVNRSPLAVAMDTVAQRRLDAAK
jgi:4-diphosphocytidyl-2-C-methyl-D-erythritol kinase